ncbi:contact-dependent growth inhibition system immunity protein [Mycobacterium sp. pV006]|uniref:contact-dependent growth inhibition system immunity protein n=1 Tax=Mycobacterium sp. pV006 TaxID=3238983 RepID=UPI00351BA99D
MNDGSLSWELSQFLGAYFHQDWDLEADSWEGLVDIYVDDHPVVDQLRTLADELDEVRDSRPEQPLQHFFIRTVGVDYNPEPVPYKEWLGQISDRLRRHADGIEKSRASGHSGTHAK